MLLILSQRIYSKSEYNDIPFEIYHYPKKYRNQIKMGDIFLYYQGDRYKKENRYYFGCGLVAEITASDDGEHYYAKVINGVKFPNTVPTYNPNGGFYESLGYEEVRQKENPPWQNSIRKVSEKAFRAILSAANLDFEWIQGLFSLDFYNSVNDADKNLFNNFLKDLREQEIEDLLENATDEDIEKILSNLDCSGYIEVRNTLQKVRKASRKTITSLKEIYNHTCQICGVNHMGEYGVNVAEAHHIEYFCESQNHQPSNIVILCPTHHRLMHAGKAIFDRERRTFVYENGYEEVLKINKHL